MTSTVRTQPGDGSDDQVNPQTRTPDEAWVRQVVHEFEQPLMRYAHRRLGDAEVAREVVQDTFLKLWQADPVSLNGHLAQWLYTVCRNRSLDVARKERRMTTMDTSETTAPPDKQTSGADQQEQHADLMDLIETLPEKQRDVVRLKFQANLSYKEIAGVLNLTVSHVGVLLHKAIKTIRQQMVAPAPGGEGEVTGPDDNNVTGLNANPGYAG